MTINPFLIVLTALPKATLVQEIVQVLLKNPACDITKTHIIAALFIVPKSQRDNQRRRIPFSLPALESKQRA